MFDIFIIVDWSAANQPKTGRDSIWICRRGADGETLCNPPTRHAAKGVLADMLAGAAERGERVIAGFDFPFGYPAGFAARLGLAGTPWRALWDEIAGLLHDNENNKNDRFDVGATLNRRVSNGNGRFPFWGCPVGFTDDFLGPRHHRGHTSDEPLKERRLIDTWMVGAQPCWKLAYTGSVGSQSLTGIPVVRGLRSDPRWADRARIWPFETGLGLPAEAQIVFAEVWPSWWRDKIRPDYGPPNDRAQVRTVAEIFAACDRAGELAAWFAGAPNLTSAERRVIETEEAWTLGVTAPKRPPKTPSPRSMVHGGAERAPSLTLPRSRKREGWGLGAENVGVRWGIPERSPRTAAVPAASAGETPAVQPMPTSPSHRPSRREQSSRLSSRRIFDAPAMGPSPGATLTRRPTGARARAPRGPLKGGEGKKAAYAYLRDPAAIYRRSFALIRAEAGLGRFPPALRPLAVRLAHAAGDVAILDDLAWSRGAVAAGHRALASGAPILVDSDMVAAGIIRDRLPAANPVICTLRDPAVPALAATHQTTRSAAAVELWHPHLAGAVVAIGNAPTALFHLLEMLAAGADKPALVLGFPVGFVGAVEAKEALIGFDRGLAYITIKGRRGGSALAAAAVNALCGKISA